MVHNVSVVDGLKVALGSLFIQIAALLTLVIMGRPPDFGDDTHRQTVASEIFWQLVVLHVLCFGCILASELKQHVEIFFVWIIFFQMAVLSQIAQFWLFVEPSEDEVEVTFTTRPTTPEMLADQSRFKMMLSLEILITGAYIVAAIVWTLMTMVRKPTFVLQITSTDNPQTDHLAAHQTMIQTQQRCVVPLILAVAVIVQDDDYLKDQQIGGLFSGLVVLLVVQNFFGYAFYYLQVADARRSHEFRSFMIRAFMWVFYLVFVVIPVVVMLLSIAILALATKWEVSRPLQVFFLFLLLEELASVIAAFWQLRPAVSLEKESLDMKERALTVLDTRAVNKFGRTWHTINKEEEIEQLSQRLEGEADDYELAIAIADTIKFKLEPYCKRERDDLDGPQHIGEILQLREDVYSAAFAYEFKRVYIDNEPSDSDEVESYFYVKPIEDAKDSAANNEQNNEPAKDIEGATLKRKKMEGKAYKMARSYMSGRYIFTWTSQMLLVCLLFAERVTSTCSRQDFMEYPPTIWITMTRYVCGSVLHFTLIQEMNEGLSFMKFATNHPWKFRQWHRAFFVGFCQFMMTILVELINLILLQTNSTTMDIIMDFLALVIISDFDDYFAQTLYSDPMFKRIVAGDHEQLNEALTVQVTTSQMARAKVPGNRLRPVDKPAEAEGPAEGQVEEVLVQPAQVAEADPMSARGLINNQEPDANQQAPANLGDDLVHPEATEESHAANDAVDVQQIAVEVIDEVNRVANEQARIIKEERAARAKRIFELRNPEEMPEWIRKRFRDRTYLNMIMRTVYKSLKVFYTSFWFYYMPFIAVILSYQVPYQLHRGGHGDISQLCASED